MDINGKRVIVTGSASGIGASAIKALVAAGARVAGMDLADEVGQAVASAATQAGPGEARYQRCDVSRKEDVDAAFTAAVDWLGGLDALVNIAGVERKSAAESISQQDWDLMFDVNARGTLNTNQAAFVHLRERGGRIVNFASAAGVMGVPGLAHYSAAKAAVLGWTRTAAKEWGRYGITVNAMAPAMWTPMYEKFRARLDDAQLQAHDAMMAQQVPLGGRLGDPDRDMAPVLVFLVSDGARFITGQTLAVDGGLMIP
ncbi:short-chain dehydrogenase [Cupriavidus sp. SHE]|jgi:NAD(P)-dependent dehydrogenase (short-subunit alcohol dehydrogenase family)|uniref:SDR family oxidoreductase n=1 Tax=Cupriavidus metallidurans TaxID=119219 RepID=A0A482IXY4_9BURK|nr:MULTISPECIES: SDR family NAD(P)-dependent oxidoreductase [Cupriavidus]KWR76307.1 short-chain dehydrogenase [Cupriavidus sp. SHE]QBP11804.1 SDR family oxidoreductase [Cupriavidus metallidurans]